MRKIRYIFLITCSFLFLNSCLTTYLLGTIGSYFCAHYDCIPDPKKNDPGGIEIFLNDNPEEAKKYIEEIKKRDLVKVEVGKNEKVYINLPKDFILKKRKGGYYLYDKKRGIGFCGIEDLRKYKNDYYIKIYEETDMKDYEFIGINKGVKRFRSSGYSAVMLYSKKLSENYYAEASYFIDSGHPKEISDIYTYLMENM